MQLYQFDTKEAKHWFCRHCGIHPFSNPRAAPDMISINVRCLDDFDLDTAKPEVIPFDQIARQTSPFRAGRIARAV